MIPSMSDDGVEAFVFEDTFARIAERVRTLSSAVYILRAMAARERRMDSVCQSCGPSYLGTGAGVGVGLSS